MPSDVNRLFSMIKQAGLPYQVFEDEAAPVPAGDAEPEELAAAGEQPANEDTAPAHAGLFRAYAAEKAQLPQGVLLADIFRSMAKQAAD